MILERLCTLALVICLACFLAAFLITSNVAGLGAHDYHPWVDGGFVAIAAALLLEQTEQRRRRNRSKETS